MAPSSSFKGSNLKKRLQPPLAARRFYHEQKIRLRFYRAGLRQHFTRRKQDRQEQGIYQNPLFTILPPEIFPEYQSYSEQNADADSGNGQHDALADGQDHNLDQVSADASNSGLNTDTKGEPDSIISNRANKAGLQIIPAVHRLFYEQIRRLLARMSLPVPSQVTVRRRSCHTDAGVAGVSKAAAAAGLLLNLLLLILPAYYFNTFRRPYPVYILIALAFAVVAIYKISEREMRLLRSPLDKAVFLLSGLAVISSIGAWNTSEAINLALLLSCCAALYWTVSSIVNNLAALRRFLAVSIAGTTAVASFYIIRIFQERASFPSAAALGAVFITALLFAFYLRTAIPSAAGQERAAVNPNDPVDVPGSSRNRSAYSSDLTALYRAYTADRNEAARSSKAVALLHRAKAVWEKYRIAHQKKWHNIVLSAASYLLLLALIGLCSALNCIMLAIGISLLLWKIPAAERKKGLAHILACAAVAFLAAGRVRFCMMSEDITISWLWVTLGFLLVVTLEYIAALSAGNLNKTGRRLRPWVRPGAVLLLTLLLLYSGANYLCSTLSPTDQPVAYYAQSYMEEKLCKGLDALVVITSSPRIILQGTGGGGWEPLAYQHQRFYYQDSPPGALAQAGVEMGLPGLIALLAVWLLFYKEMAEQVSLGRLRQSTIGVSVTGGRCCRFEFSSYKTVQLHEAVSAAWAILTPTLIVGIYTLVECTLSMAALALLLFTLFGLGTAFSRCSEAEHFAGTDGTARSDQPLRFAGSKAFERCEHPQDCGQDEPPDAQEHHGRHKNSDHLFMTAAGTKRQRLSRCLHSPGIGNKLLQFSAVIGAVLLVTLISLNSFAAENHALEAAQAIKQRDIRTAEIKYQQAVHKAPFNAEYRKELGKTYLMQEQLNDQPAQPAQPSSTNAVRINKTSEIQLLGFSSSIYSTSGTYCGTSSVQTNPQVSISSGTLPNPQNIASGKHCSISCAQASFQNTNEGPLNLACEQFKRGILLARGDAELRTLYASTLIQTGQPEEGVWQLETAVLLRPLQQDLYENLALGYVTAARMLIITAAVPLITEKAHLYLSRTMAIPQLLEKRAARIDKRHLRHWSGAPYLGVTPKIQLSCGQAAALLGDRQTARCYLEQAARDASLKAEAELWRSQL